MPNPDRFKVGCILITLPNGESFYFDSYLDRDPFRYVTSDVPVTFPYVQALGFARVIRGVYPSYSVEVIGVA